MNNKDPYLSIVITSRNDNYQGDSFKRMQVAIDNLVAQARRYNLRAELILVEWNSPQDLPLLKDALSFPDDLSPLVIRFIIVPPGIHKKYNASNKLNIISTVALNIGIRRARGNFIFATNADILFSNELIKFLSLEKLDKRFFYRANRFDVSGDVMKCSSMEEIIDFCKKNIIQTYLKDDTSPHGLAEHPTLHVNGGDFILFSKEYWHLLHGWPELNNLGLYSDGLLCYMAYLAGLKEKILDDSFRVYHIDHESRWKRLAESKSKIIRFFEKNIYKRLNENKLKLLIRRASRFVDKFVILTLGRNDTIEEMDFDLRRLRLGYEKTLKDLLMYKKSYIYNNDAWGWPQEKFEEFIISSGNIIKK